MKKASNLRRGRTCVFIMHVHLVFVTKYRQKVFTEKILADLKPIFVHVCTRFNAELVECEGEYDHVHLLVNYPPTCTVSRLVNSLKGVSSRLIRKKKYPTIEKALWGGSLWSPSYFASSCGGASLDVITQYIANQKNPTKGLRKNQ